MIDDGDGSITILNRNTDHATPEGLIGSALLLNTAAKYLFEKAKRTGAMGAARLYIPGRSA